MHGTNVGCDAARAVARNFGMGAIRVAELNFNIGGKVRSHPLDAVSSDAVVAVADAAGRGVDQQEVITAGARLHERNAATIGLHSRSTRPSEIAVPNTVDAFNWPNNTSCSPEQPSTSNCRRTCWPVSPVSMFCIRR